MKVLICIPQPKETSLHSATVREVMVLNLSNADNDIVTRTVNREQLSPMPECHDKIVILINLLWIPLKMYLIICYAHSVFGVILHFECISSFA